MNNSFKLFILGFFAIFTLQGNVLAEDINMDEVIDKITEACEQEAIEQKNSDDAYIDACINERVQKEKEKMENTPAE